MNLKDISTEELLNELNEREHLKYDEILMFYRNGKSLKEVKNKFGSYGIEVIIQNLSLNHVSIPQRLYDLFLD